MVFPCVGQVCADQVSWTGGVSGDWEEPTNWSNDALPGAEDDVVVDSGHAVSIYHDSGETVVGSLRMVGTLRIQGGSITVSGSSSIDGQLTVSNGAALIADGSEAEIVVSGAADIGTGDILAIAGGHIVLPGITRYQGGGRLRAEGPGSLLELKNLESIGIGEPESIDSLYEAISREYSGYQNPSLPEKEIVFVSYSREVSGYQHQSVPVEGSEKGLLTAFSREISGYQHQSLPVEGGEKGVFAAFSREISGFQHQSVPSEGTEKGIFASFSREVSGFQHQFVPTEGSEKGIYSVSSREISAFHRQLGLGEAAETVINEAISHEVSLEHLTSPE